MCIKSSAGCLVPVAGAPSPRGTILVLHGIRDRKTNMLGVGRLLSQNGFRAILIDLRGHGDSSGDRLTCGIVEARDLSQVVDELSRRGLLSGALGVYGPSYGGAVAIQLAALDPRVRAVAAVSTFSSNDHLTGFAQCGRAHRRASRECLARAGDRGESGSVPYSPWPKANRKAAGRTGEEPE